MKIEKYHISKTYNEIDRRIEGMINNGDLETPEEIREERNAMLQGVYSAYMMISDNWPDVCEWCKRNEEERGYYAE